MNAKLVLSMAFVLSLCVACSERDSGKPDVSTVETVGVNHVKQPELPEIFKEKSFTTAKKKCATSSDEAKCICEFLNPPGRLTYSLDGKTFKCYRGVLLGE